jgi:hypothetical protein
MKKHIRIEQTGYGHYRISMIIYNKKFSTITTNSSAVDEYRDFDNTRRSNVGYRALYSELMHEYKAKLKKVTS